MIRWLVVAFSVVFYCVHLAESNTALLIIDVQNCFLPGGSLAVTDGERVIPVINNIRSQYGDKFTVTVLTQDWHCSDHVSFASQHPGKGIYGTVWLAYDSTGNLCSNDSCQVEYNISQTLWPDHCVINTTGANFSGQLIRRGGDIVVRKGYKCDVDSYSGFYDNGGFSQTELDTILRRHGITRVVVTGLALDYCVYYTSKDAKRLGYDTYLVLDASKPVAMATKETAVEDLKVKGIKLIDSSDLGEIFNTSGTGITEYTTILQLYFVYMIFTKILDVL